MLTPSDALLIEYKALKCLRQGEDTPIVMSAAKKYAQLAARRLHREKYFDAAKLVDNNCK